MTITKKKVLWFICDKCGHEWTNSKQMIPVCCAKCKNARWNYLHKNKMNKKDDEGFTGDIRPGFGYD